MKIEEAVAIAKKEIELFGERPEQRGAFETIVRAYLAFHREDDGEQVPFRESECGQYSVFIGLDGAYVLRIGEGNTLLLHAKYKTRPTMGQLRHLIRGLGGEA